MMPNDSQETSFPSFETVQGECIQQQSKDVRNLLPYQDSLPHVSVSKENDKALRFQYTARKEIDKNEICFNEPNNRK